MTTRIAEAPFVDDLLIGAERAVHAKGWDKPATLFCVRVEQDRVSVRVFPGWTHAVTLTGHSVQAADLCRVALSLASPGERPDLSGLFAILLVDEAWVVAAHDRLPGLRNVENPASVEHRFAWLLGIDGSSRALTRSRGGEPEFFDGMFQQGRLLDALKGLIAEATR